MGCGTSPRPHIEHVIRRLISVLVLAAAPALAADAAPKAPSGGRYSQATVDPMKTSIYIGSVRLVTAVFARQGDNFEATYEVKVFPFFFYNESGRITLRLPDPELRRLAGGETLVFNGEAVNHRKKKRSIEVRAEPADAARGKLKISIMADGIRLIFHGTYRFIGRE